MDSYPETHFLHSVRFLVYLIAEAEAVQYLYSARLKPVCMTILDLTGTHIYQYGFDAIYGCPCRRHDALRC
jgi:hypothetical protein